MIVIAEMVRDKGLEVYVFHASENIHIYRRISLAELTKQLLYLCTLGAALASGYTAGALYEAEIIVFGPADNIIFTDKADG